MTSAVPFLKQKIKYEINIANNKDITFLNNFTDIEKNQKYQSY